jgi:hypothetical protein
MIMLNRTFAAYWKLAVTFMSVEQTDVIDIVSLDKRSDRVFLTVSDHLPWDGEHLLTLQEKLNAYLRFLESGEVYDHYPSAKGREFVIQVLAMYRPNEQAVAFFELAASSVADAGFTLTVGPGPGGYCDNDG